MDNLRLLQRVRGGYIAVLARGWRVDGSIVVDATNISELKEKLSKATRDDGWKTINGAHVLLDKNNYIVAGAGGKFAGMKFGMKFHKPIMVRGKKSFGLYGTHKIQKMRVAKKQKKDEFEPITNTRQIKSRLTTAGFDLKSLRGMDKELQLDTANQLLRLEQKFGLMREAKVTVRMSSATRYVAYVSKYYIKPEEMELVFNPKYFGNKADLLKMEERSIQRGWHPPAKKDSLKYMSVTHEYGHMLENVVMSREMNKIKANKRLFGGDAAEIIKSLQNQYMNEIKDICRKNNPNVDFSNVVSGYGKKNGAEFFAEAFANSQLGEPNEIGRAMNIWLKQKGLC